MQAHEVVADGPVRELALFLGELDETLGDAEGVTLGAEVGDREGDALGGVDSATLGATEGDPDGLID